MDALETSQTTIEEGINGVLASLKPLVASHGGDIQFVSYSDNVLTVRLYGACVGCPASYYTVQQGIFNAVRAHFPGLKEVIALED